MQREAVKVEIIPARPELAVGNAVKRQLRVAAYCRVSTDDEEQLTSYEAQRAYYTDYIMKNKDWTMAGIFADEGITGTSARKRPEFLRTIRCCKQKKIDIILTKLISRFARNTVDCLNYVRALKALGIAVIFEKESINTLESDSEIIITMMGAFAQAESESISANVRWGVRQAMREGRVKMPYDKLYAYRRGESGETEIIPEQAGVVVDIYNRFLMGDSLRMIKKRLEAEHISNYAGKYEWTISSIRGILTNEKYCGDVLMQKTFISDCISKKVIRNTGQLPMYLVRNHHEGIVSRETFDAVQTELARRNSRKSPSQKYAPTGKSSYTSKYALSDRLVCGECGTLYRRCTWVRKEKKRVVWRCVSRVDYGTRYCHQSPTIDEDRLQRGILAAINSVMSSKEELIQHMTGALGEELSANSGREVKIADIDHRLDELNKKFQMLLNEVSEEGVDGYTEQFKSIVDETAALKEQKAKLVGLSKANEETRSRIDQVMEAMRDTSPNINEWNESMIRQLVDSVKVVSADEIIVYLKGGTEINQKLA